MEGSCLCFGRAGHKSPDRWQKDKIKKDDCAINKSTQDAQHAQQLQSNNEEVRSTSGSTVSMKIPEPMFGWAGLHCSFAQSINMKNLVLCWTAIPLTQSYVTRTTYQTYEIRMTHWVYLQMEEWWNHTKSVISRTSTMCGTMKIRWRISLAWKTWLKDFKSRWIQGKNWHCWYTCQTRSSDLSNFPMDYMLWIQTTKRVSSRNHTNF